MSEQENTAHEQESEDSKYLLAQAEGLRALSEELDRRKRDAAGNVLPLYAWRPLCEPWFKGSNATYQLKMPLCKARYIVAVPANRVGKTLTGAVMAVGRAMGRHPFLKGASFKVPQNVWVGANPKFVSVLFAILEKLVPPDQIKNAYRSPGEQRIDFHNGSRITMKSFGMSRNEWQMEEVNFLWLDEEFPEELWPEMNTRLNAEDSQCLITATLIDASPFLFELTDDFNPAWQNSHQGEGPIRVSWFTASMYDNARLPKEYVAAQEYMLRKNPEERSIRIMGVPVRLQGTHIFRAALPSVKDHLRPAIGHYWFAGNGRPMPVEERAERTVDVYDLPRVGMRYVVGADLAEGGITGDYTTAHVICVDTSSVVAKIRVRMEPGPFGRILAYLGWWYNTAVINWEFNMQGAAVKDRLVQMKYRNLARRESFSGRVDISLDQYGFRTSAESKQTIIGDVRDALGDGVLVMPDQETFDELHDFGYLKTKGTRGFNGHRSMGVLAPGEHDDLVMSLAIAWYTTRFAQPPKPGLFAPVSLTEALYQEWEQEQRPRKGKGIRRSYSLR